MVGANGFDRSFLQADAVAGLTEWHRANAGLSEGPVDSGNGRKMFEARKWEKVGAQPFRQKLPPPA